MILTTKNAGKRRVWTLVEMADEFGVSRQAMRKWVDRRPQFAPDIEMTFADERWNLQLWESESMKRIREARNALT